MTTLCASRIDEHCWRGNPIDEASGGGGGGGGGCSWGLLPATCGVIGGGSANCFTTLSAGSYAVGASRVRELKRVVTPCVCARCQLGNSSTAGDEATRKCCCGRCAASALVIMLGVDRYVATPSANASALATTSERALRTMLMHFARQVARPRVHAAVFTPVFTVENSSTDPRAKSRQTARAHSRGVFIS